MVKLFCAIVRFAGCSFPVDIDENETVGDLKKVIRDAKPNDLKDVDPDKLQLFLAKNKGKGSWVTEKDVEEGVNDTSNLKSLNVMREPLSMAGLSEKDVAFEVKVEHVKARTTPVNVLVVVPPSVGSKRPATEEAEGEIKRLKLVEPKTLTEFTPLSVNEDEFQLDKLSTIQASASPIVPTPTLHKFWEGFGEFPPHYLVRMEEVVFWKVIKPLMFGKHRIVLIGSPGVGKSCFLMLLAFYLACEMKKKVLVIRRVKAKNAVVFFDGQGSYARLLNLSSADIRAIRDQAQGALVLVDGFNQAAVEDNDKGYEPFHFLATSCQYDAKQSDESHIVVLPAWRQDDLLKYATLTDWVVETGLREVKRVNTPFQELVSEQYFYSGGSLREFCERIDCGVTTSLTAAKKNIIIGLSIGDFRWIRGMC
ncbi:Crinkler (CRN) [Phytophthora megakarya]|uniref:Crinkler (CRN) n=1 Tax=Phytophthora megakarya TaxID=4795 RepID=A0A225UX17_9STRA|nr:Crinkler (CRN) [Phytophthora megakarya]